MGTPASTRCCWARWGHTASSDGRSCIFTFYKTCGHINKSFQLLLRLLTLIGRSELEFCSTTAHCIVEMLHILVPHQQLGWRIETQRSLRHCPRGTQKEALLGFPSIDTHEKIPPNGKAAVGAKGLFPLGEPGGPPGLTDWQQHTALLQVDNCAWRLLQDTEQRSQKESYPDLSSSVSWCFAPKQLDQWHREFSVFSLRTWQSSNVLKGKTKEVHISISPLSSTYYNEYLLTINLTGL